MVSRCLSFCFDLCAGSVDKRVTPAPALAGVLSLNRPLKSATKSSLAFSTLDSSSAYHLSSRLTVTEAESGMNFLPASSCSSSGASPSQVRRAKDKVEANNKYKLTQLERGSANYASSASAMQEDEGKPSGYRSDPPGPRLAVAWRAEAHATMRR